MLPVEKLQQTLVAVLGDPMIPEQKLKAILKIIKYMMSLRPFDSRCGLTAIKRLVNAVHKGPGKEVLKIGPVSVAYTSPLGGLGSVSESVC